MKNRTDHEELLDAVLLEAPAHEASLRAVRRAARRRRWSRHFRHGAVIVVVLVTGFLLFQPKHAGDQPASVQILREAPYVVHTSALPDGFAIHTDQKSVNVVTTMKSGVEFFSTMNAKPPERIDDEMLLLLAPGAALVRHQPGTAELLFPSHPDPETESRTRPE